MRPESRPSRWARALAAAFAPLSTAAAAVAGSALSALSALSAGGAVGALFAVGAVGVAATGCDMLMGHQGEGEKLYREHCANCHGADGRGDTVQGMGNPYADLIDNTWKFGGDDSSIAGVIRDGSFGLMPAYRDKLTEPQIRAIVRHIRTLRGERPPPEGGAP